MYSICDNHNVPLLVNYYSKYHIQEAIDISHLVPHVKKNLLKLHEVHNKLLKATAYCIAHQLMEQELYS